MKLMPIGSVLAALVLLTACSSEDLKLDNDWAVFTDKTKVQLLNVSQTPLNFHLGSFTETNGAPVISEQKYLLGSVEAGQPPKDVELKRSYTNHKLSVQVFDMLTKAPGEFVQLSSPPEKPLQVVAWQEDSKVRISVFRRESSSQNGVYRVRLLAVADGVQLKAGTSQVTLNKGQLSDWFSLQQCQGELQLNHQPLDLCQATPGQSFLAVLNQQKLLSLSQI